VHGQIKDQLRRHQRFLAIIPTLKAAEGSPVNGAAIAALREATAIEPHTRLMEAALDRDIPAARALMTDHIESTIRAFGHAEINELGSAAPRVAQRNRQGS
jgi:DNA-binding GntR family transcriptional regulator